MYDIAVIGGGPAGLSAAVQARVRNKSVLVVSGDDRDNPLRKTQRIDNYLGFPQVSGQELLDRFQTHAAQMGAEQTALFQNGAYTETTEPLDQATWIFPNNDEERKDNNEYPDRTIL